MKQTPKIAFFGGEPLGLPALKALVHDGLIPTLAVCNPDRESGRGQKLTAPPIKTWALEQSIPVLQPVSYKSKDDFTHLINEEWDLFVVVAYNFILPKWLLDIPKHGVVNVHPSLLPKLRGASPIRSALLNNLQDEVGVSIMLMDEEMDHGPILAQAPLTLNHWPINGELLDDMLAQIGGEMLATTIPRFLGGEITPVAQDHSAATYTKKFAKADAELSLNPQALPTGEAAFQAFSKICAFAGMSDCFFFDNTIRIKIKAATLSEDGQLQILRVTPEGKKEVDFETYLRSR